MPTVAKPTAAPPHTLPQNLVEAAGTPQIVRTEWLAASGYREEHQELTDPEPHSLSSHHQGGVLRPESWRGHHLLRIGAFSTARATPPH